MLNLLKVWFSIAFLMSKPYDHPADKQSIQSAWFVGLLSGVFAWLVTDSLWISVLFSLLDLGFAALLLKVALGAVGLPNRFHQAFASFCGAGVIINLAYIPVTFNLKSTSGEIGTLAAFVMLTWSMTVIVHIIRHTFDLSIPVGVLVAFVYYMVSSTLFLGLGGMLGVT